MDATFPVRSRASTALTSLMVVALATAGITTSGCGPQDAGSISIAGSKAIAAERGLGAAPGGPKPGKTNKKLPKGVTSHKSPQDRKAPG